MLIDDWHQTVSGEMSAGGDRREVPQLCRLLPWLLAIILIGSTLDYSKIPESIFLLVTVPAIAAFGIIGIYYRPGLEIPRFALIAYTAIWLVYIPHAVFPTANVWALIRIPAFMVGLFVLLFIVPQFVSLKTFITMIFYIVAMLGILGLPTIILGSYEMIGEWGQFVEAWPEKSSTPILGFEIYPLTSVFANPNPFGFVASIGTVAGLNVVTRRKDVVHVILFAIVGLSVYLTLSRAAYLATVVAVTIYLGYRYLGRKFAFMAVGLGLLSAMYLFPASLGYLPDFVGVRNVFEGGRLVFWTRAIETWSQSPLFGIGFQPISEEIGQTNLHNGYLYPFLTRGIVGGLVQLGFLGLVLHRRLTLLRDGETATLLSMFLIVLVIMAFEAIILFGFSSQTVWPALVVGYAIFDSPD